MGKCLECGCNAALGCSRCDLCALLRVAHERGELLRALKIAERELTYLLGSAYPKNAALCKVRAAIKRAEGK